MPNATARRTRKAATAKTPAVVEVPTVSEEIVTVTTATQLPDFTSLIEPAPEGYKPDRSPAGRKRTPSQFEAVLPQYKGAGWQKLRHDGNVTVDAETGKALPESLKASDAHVIKRELQKAQHFLGLGMDLHITATHVEFNVRDLQKRERGNAEATGEVASDEDDE